MFCQVMINCKMKTNIEGEDKFEFSLVVRLKQELPSKATGKNLFLTFHVGWL